MLEIFNEYKMAIRVSHLIKYTRNRYACMLYILYIISGHVEKWTCYNIIV